ncbi:thermonuclease family protein [Alteraurantiacibacter aestuarii]|uniref:thermonuclease family protein n=1 Tax=Alteraurantiacibacter aestuarii TaxID=650004 RepID=UPI00301C51B5
MTRALLLLLVFPFLLAAQDLEQGQFSRCSGSGRITCVVDGDTIWYRGDKIRLADINTPEISRPACRREAELGEEATVRLTILLNQGPFTLVSEGRNLDRYGRQLRIVMRDGRSLGAILVAEGLAEQWQGRRGDWCEA